MYMVDSLCFLTLEKWLFVKMSFASPKIHSPLILSAVILEPPKIKSDTVPTVSPSIFHEVMGPDAMIFVL